MIKILIIIINNRHDSFKVSEKSFYVLLFSRRVHILLDDAEKGNGIRVDIEMIN